MKGVTIGGRNANRYALSFASKSRLPAKVRAKIGRLKLCGASALGIAHKLKLPYAAVLDFLFTPVKPGGTVAAHEENAEADES